MKEELDMNEVEQVVGGTVVVTNKGYVSFSKLRESYRLQNCTWREARNCAEDELDAHSDMSETEFDQYIRDLFHSKGWI